MGNKDEAFFAYYDAESIESSEGLIFANFENHKRNIFASQPWIQVMVDNVRAIPGPGYWVTWFDQYYRAPGLSSTTGKRFYWLRDTDGEWRIAGREYTPASEQLDAKYLAAKSEEVRQVVEAWRAAWLATDVEAYRNFYLSQADQGGGRAQPTLLITKRHCGTRRLLLSLKLMV